MDAEMDTPMICGNWYLVPCPCDIKIVACHLVYNMKYNFDGFITCYETTLVAKRFIQTWGGLFKFSLLWLV